MIETKETKPVAQVEPTPIDSTLNQPIYIKDILGNLPILVSTTRPSNGPPPTPPAPGPFGQLRIYTNDLTTPTTFELWVYVTGLSSNPWRSVALT